MNTNSSKFAIKANFILYGDTLISGYLFINGQYIADIVEQNDTNKIQSLLEFYPIQFTYYDEVLMAGGIDLSCALNPAFVTEWSYIESFTKCSLSGGTCLIINKPYQYYDKVENDLIEEYQCEMYKKQVEDMLEKSQVDFIQSTFINAQTLPNLRVMEQLGARIFWVFLSQTYLKDIESIKDHLELAEIINQLSEMQLKLMIHMQRAVEKDFGVTSPFRLQRANQRYDPMSNSQMADGIQGNISSDEEKVSDNSSDFECQSPLSELISKSKESLPLTPKESGSERMINMMTSPEVNGQKFFRQSKDLAKKSQHQLISRTELLTYSQQNDYVKQSCESIPEEVEDQLGQNMTNQLFQNYTFGQIIGTQYPSDKEILSFDDNQSQSSESPEQVIRKNRTRSLSGSTLLQRRKNSFLKLDLVTDTQKFCLTPIQVMDEKQSLKQIKKFMKFPLESNSRFSRDYLCFLAFRPDTWELFSLTLLNKALKLCYPSQLCSTLLSGFSSSMTLGKIIQIKNAKIFTEIAYPYQFFDSQLIPEGGTIFKGDPPFRSKENKYLLQKALYSSSWISCIGSGHFYVDPSLKFRDLGDFRRAFSGITTIGIQFQAIWTIMWARTSKRLNLDHLKAKRILIDNTNKTYRDKIIQKLVKLQELVSKGAAKYLNQEDLYGSLKQNSYANIVVWDPFQFTNFEIKNQDFEANMHLFSQQMFLGKIEAVFLRGQIGFQSNHNEENFSRVTSKHIII